MRFYGSAGAFSEDAAREFFKIRGGSTDHVEFIANPGNLDGLFSATVADDADCYAVVPFENQPAADGSESPGEEEGEEPGDGRES